MHMPVTDTINILFAGLEGIDIIGFIQVPVVQLLLEVHYNNRSIDTLRYQLLMVIYKYHRKRSWYLYLCVCIVINIVMWLLFLFAQPLYH